MNPTALQAQHIGRRVSRLLRIAIQRHQAARDRLAVEHHAEAMRILRDEADSTAAAIEWHAGQHRAAVARLRSMQHVTAYGADSARSALSIEQRVSACGQRVGAALLCLSGITVIGLVSSALAWWLQ